MGLDCSHDAFHGAYSAFNRLRQEISRSIGGSYPPHWKYRDDGSLLEDGNGLVVYDKDLDENQFYYADEFNPNEYPGLHEFLTHSDCDGEISPEMCIKVADDLEKILPKVEALNSASGGHIAARGGYAEVIRKFIAGCRKAAAEDQPLEFR